MCLHAIKLFLSLIRMVEVSLEAATEERLLCAAYCYYTHINNNEYFTSN